MTGPIPAIERASAMAIRLYDHAAAQDDAVARSEALLLLAYLREARKGDE